MLSYQDILRDEYLNRRSKNNLYSIRAYARDLGMSQPFLTQVLGKKRKLSDEKAIQISEKLKLKANQKKLFVNLVRYELAGSLTTREILFAEIQGILKKNPEYFVLPEDSFRIVSDWYYYAILEMIGMKGFKNDIAWISKKLTIPEIDVEIALRRLKRVGLLVEKGNKLEKVQQNYIFENVPSEALRKHHHQTLDLAHAALEKHALDEREFTAVTLTMDPKKIGKAKQMIKEFTEHFMSEMEKTEARGVYKVALQLFRLDKENV